MRSDILQKIEYEIHEGVNDEKTVLYIFAQIRKYLELNSLLNEEKYENLNLYCNWVLHPLLERNSSSKKLLERLEGGIKGHNNLNAIEEYIKLEEKDFYKFNGLKRELTDFFTVNEITTHELFKGKNWFKFKKLLYNILIDCPLTNTIEGGRIKKFKFETNKTNEITFRIEIKKLGSVKIILKEKYK